MVILTLFTGLHRGWNHAGVGAASFKQLSDNSNYQLTRQIILLTIEENDDIYLCF